MEKNFDNSALIIIDVQKGFDFEDYWGKRNNPQCEENIAKLIAHWKSNNRKVIYVQHMSNNPKSTLYVGQVGNEYKEIVCVAEYLGDRTEVWLSVLKNGKETKRFNTRCVEAIIWEPEEKSGNKS